MRFISYLRSMLIFARLQPWVDAPAWGKEDAVALAGFMGSPAGARFKAIMANTVLRQQAHAIAKVDTLPFEAGYCNGQKGLIAVIEALADTHQFTEQGEQDADPATNQPES